MEEGVEVREGGCFSRVDVEVGLRVGVEVREGGLSEGFFSEAEMVVVRDSEVERLSIREGGGGRGARTEARQRKHSPVPKYLGAMCG